MGYVSKRGRRPDEAASKSSHSHVINDNSVKTFLEHCRTPKTAAEVELSQHIVRPFILPADNPIRHIVAIDGGYTEVAVRTEFPSATIAFIQFGALLFSTFDLASLEEQPFIDPKDMAKLKNIQRLKLTLPIRNITYKEEATLTRSVRRALYDFFMMDLDGRPLMSALAWLVFERYRAPSQFATWELTSCPNCGTTHIPLSPENLTFQFVFTCPACHGTIYLTDVFRLHEGIDDELGASGILGNATTAIEQLVMVWVIKFLLEKRPNALREVLFIKDGPLAFFGHTSNMHKPLRTLVNYLFDHYELFLAGLEKSGSFVEHADEITQRLPAGSHLILDNDYIYRYIVPGSASSDNVYGRPSYYGNKLIYKTLSGGTYVVTLPTRELLAYPAPQDFRNLDIILHNLHLLKCDMYDSSLLPVALVNKLVSLANHPSAALLKTFATKSMPSS